LNIRFWWGSPKEGDHFSNLGTGGRILLKQVLQNMGWDGMDRIYLA
jgi:hypothetical protein